MEPTYLKRLETLLRDLMDGKQLRRFIGNLFGRQVTSQLPEDCTHELLANGTVALLERNGLINQELFIELVGERPQMQGQIAEVAQIFGLAVVSANDTSSVPAWTPRTPDYVIRDTYADLRRQRTLLRQLTHGDIHLSRIFGVIARQDERAMVALPGRVVAWIDTHRHEFSLPDLQSALATVHTLASLFLVQTEAGLVGSLVALYTGQLEPTMKSLYNFADRPDQDLYALALKLASTR